ncbi:MotA/TolQ/ExbB proton channel family protein [Jiulongibacter sediminis]|uniref:Flagellar motor protein MotA n=1 Tax=Jiulongibacter sediminis TaxID=1605367 RepID=A0A0P7B974_9BACT|nr:MotA/TolQ/ExbB proton channel family protein [Jiulongibacter sediminis]KPM46894.1 flagellar motor protein MotA [Jiulongibacter sediminis]TBX22244.1 flagellar motor protein MotA [Jiulongibacter sediminis]
MEKKTTAPAAKPANKKAATQKKSGGLGSGLIIFLLLILGILIYSFILGSPSNFDDQGHPTNFMGIIYKGGIIVPILITCLLTTIVFSIERFITIGKSGGKGNLDVFVNKIRSMVSAGNLDEAIKECDKQKGTVGNVAKTALQKYNELVNEKEFSKDQKLAALQKEVDEATSLELPMLEKNLSILSTLGSVSTLIALLGTVLGMIRSFFAIGEGGGAPDAAELATGIAEALINTGLGIGTSAVAIIMYNLFTSKIDGLTYKIDEIGMSLQQTFSANN